MSEPKSSETDLAVLVVSCDAYRDLWHPFFQCFFKYWPDCPYSVYLGSNLATYPDARVNSIAVGKDIDYSSNLIAMIGSIAARWLILWIDDRMLSGPVHTARLAALVKAAQENRAGFVKLIASHPFAVVGDRTREIGEIPRGTSYRVCMTIGLWNKATLLKLLQPGETAWQIERHASQRSYALNDGFYALSHSWRHRPPIHAEHMIIRGRLLRDARKFLAREGLQEHFSGRPLQTLRSYCYVKAYLMVRDWQSQLRWQLRRVSSQ